MIRRAGWVLIVVGALSACKERAEPKPYVPTGSGSAAPAPAVPAAPTATTVEPGRMFSEAEITALLDDLMKRLDATAKRACPGPQVQATNAPGRSAELLVPLFEGTGELAACITRLGELGKADLPAAAKAKSADVMTFDKECGDKLAAQILAAAARTDGCSPYQVGVHAEPKEMFRSIQVAHVVALRARELSAKGDVEAAVDLSTSALRIYQDLARGHVNYISAMIAVACTEIIGANLDTLLGTAKLSGAARASTAAHLDALIAAMPQWPDIMAGERDNMDIYFGAAQLMPDTWTPPGGWNEGVDPRKAGKDTYPTKRFGDPRDESAVLLLMTVENTADLVKACPAGSTYAACQAGLAKLEAAAAAAAKPAPEGDLGKLYAALAVAAKAGDVEATRKQIRSSVVSILKAVAQPGISKYASKVATSLARLAELRIHVEALGTCDPPKLTVLGSPPLLGAPVEVRVTGTAIEVRPPAWADDKKVWTFACAK